MGDVMDVVVVGSCMIDLICYAPRLPNNGETLKGSDFFLGFGGKGCNQCVAAGKLGARTALVARVGNDSFGRDYLKRLQELNIPTDHVRLTEGVSSGMAQITVSRSGENHIIIVPGANNSLSEVDVKDAADMIKNCKVLMCQMEINEAVTKKVMEMKALSGLGKIIFNGAPADACLDADFFSIPDIFCVNESEAEIFASTPVRNVEEARKGSIKLLEKGCREVIITLGEQGAVYAVRGSDEVMHIPAEKVKPVDTTGAGDAFIGALGYYIAKFPNMTMPEAIKRACKAASISVQRKGTQESFATISEMKAEICD